MAKSMYDLYQDLLDAEEESSKSLMNFGKKRHDDDEVDTLFGSEDLAKIKKDLPDVPDVLTPKGPKKDDVDEIHFHRYTTRREHKYTETEMNEIRKSCEMTIVHDFSENDMFHQTDEERARNDLLAEIRMKLHGLKSTYSKVDQYITAMRTVVEACEMIEKKANFIHTEDEFYEMISEGRIYITGVPMPRLRKADRYNTDLLIKYISNPELDPADLVIEQQTGDDFYDDDFLGDDDESDEDKMYRLLSEEECKYITENEDNPPEMKVHNIEYKYIKGYDNKGSMFKSKKKKKDNKTDRLIKEDLHSILNKIQSNPANNEYGYSASWLIANSMFVKDEEKDIWDDLYFDGSWTNKNDLFLYDMAVRDKILDQHPVGERYLTNQEKELQEFFRILEDNDVNVVELRRRMNMSSEQLKKVETKKINKENEKIESALIQRIEKLNGDPKFKKLVSKAEKAINKRISEY